MERKGEEEELGREEVREVIRKLKDGKAVGGDGIQNEVWKYGGGGDEGVDMGHGDMVENFGRRGV